MIYIHKDMVESCVPVYSQYQEICSNADNLGNVSLEAIMVSSGLGQAIWCFKKLPGFKKEKLSFCVALLDKINADLNGEDLTQYKELKVILATSEDIPHDLGEMLKGDCNEYEAAKEGVPLARKESSLGQLVASLSLWKLCDTLVKQYGLPVNFIEQTFLTAIKGSL